MKDGEVKIADFGTTTENLDKKTKAQTIRGTSFYFPPELLVKNE
jgi:serine/threonine protein kinase